MKKALLGHLGRTFPHFAAFRSLRGYPWPHFGSILVRFGFIFEDVLIDFISISVRTLPVFASCKATSSMPPRRRLRAWISAFLTTCFHTPRRKCQQHYIHHTSTIYHHWHGGGQCALALVDIIYIYMYIYIYCTLLGREL